MLARPPWYGYLPLGPNLFRSLLSLQFFPSSLMAKIYSQYQPNRSGDSILEIPTYHTADHVHQNNDYVDRHLDVLSQIVRPCYYEAEDSS
jgi:hypothetical protein